METRCVVTLWTRRYFELRVAARPVITNRLHWSPRGDIPFKIKRFHKCPRVGLPLIKNTVSPREMAHSAEEMIQNVLKADSRTVQYTSTFLIQEMQTQICSARCLLSLCVHGHIHSPMGGTPPAPSTDLCSDYLRKALLYPMYFILAPRSSRYQHPNSTS